MQRPRLPVLSLILATLGIILVIFATLSPLAVAGSVSPDPQPLNAMPDGRGLQQQATPTIVRGSPGPTATATPAPDPDKVPTPIFFAGVAISFAAGIAVGYYLGTRSRGGPIGRGPQQRG